ncbi:MAG: RAD55 family ATPase [Candidatus Hodarchaeota archaeon]
MKSKIRYWRTGIDDLDRLLFNGRGFRSGRAYIVSGEHQAGKTILAMYFLKSMIAQGGAFTYITIGRPAKDLVELYQDFNIDINSYLEAKDLVILDWASLRAGGSIIRAKKHLRNYLSEKAVAGVRFGEDPCNKEEFLERMTTIHEEKAAHHGKPGLAVIDAISDQIVMADRGGLPGNVVSDIYFTARQKFSIEEPGTAFHLFAPLEERVKREYSQLLEDLHLNEDGTIGLTVEKDETGAIRERILAVRSLPGGEVPSQRLLFRVTSKVPIETIRSLNENELTPRERMRLAKEEKILSGREDGSMARGMHFHGSVTVSGNIINIEGEQYNVQQDSKETVLAVINRLLLRGIKYDEDIIPTLDALAGDIDQRNDIKPEDIAGSVQSNLQPELQNPGIRQNIESIYKQLAVGASGSLLATGIIQGIKLLVGIP